MSQVPFCVGCFFGKKPAYLLFCNNCPIGTKTMIQFGPWIGEFVAINPPKVRLLHHRLYEDLLLTFFGRMIRGSGIPFENFSLQSENKMDAY